MYTRSPATVLIHGLVQSINWDIVMWGSSVSGCFINTDVHLTDKEEKDKMSAIDSYTVYGVELKKTKQ